MVNINFNNIQEKSIDSIVSLKGWIALEKHNNRYGKGDISIYATDNHLGF